MREVNSSLNPGSVEWWLKRHELRLRRKPRKDGLTLERITAEALRIADAEGIAVLTMRRLADVLGAGPASLYRHVASREELIVEMMDHVLGELKAPTAKSWRRGAAQLARDLRRTFQRHPSMIPPLPDDLLLGPNAMRAREFGLSYLIKHGYEPRDAAEIYALLARHVIGSALLDTSVPVHGRSTTLDRHRVYGAVPAHEFPTVVSMAAGTYVVDDERLFEITLSAILDAIESRYVRRSTSPR